MTTQPRSDSPREEALDGSRPFQYDAAWINDYRRGVAFNALGMLTPTRFASEQERDDYRRLTSFGKNEEREKLLKRGREEELDAAIAEQRDPIFEHPDIVGNDIWAHHGLLLDLQTRILRLEPNEVVRRLYLGDPTTGTLGAISYHVHFLELIEATSRGDSEAFWQHNLAINPLPTSQEMYYALSRVKWLIREGMQSERTRKVSQQLIAFFNEHFSLKVNELPDTEDLGVGPCFDVSLYGKPSSLPPQPQLSPEATRTFFSALLRDQGCLGWETFVDYSALTTRLEPGLKYYILAGTPYPLNKVVELVAHEWLAHLSPRMFGERSALGLLGIGTGRSLTAEEGAGLYYEWELAKRQGTRFDESRIWLGTLSTGLAGGVLVPPQGFYTLYRFFETFLLLYRLIWRADEDLAKATERARSIARQRCLRHLRGVPPGSRLGTCYSKDAHYERGFLQVYNAVQHDPLLLDWLASGVVALDEITDLQSLGLVPAPNTPRALLERPDLEDYILSFETNKEKS